MNPRLLIVDDDKEMRELLQNAFSDKDFVVHVCETGASAEEILEHKKFEVLIIDILLNGSTGIELIKKNRAKGNTTPVIAITGSSELRHAVDAIRLNVFDYFIKPFSISDLIHSTELAAAKRSAEDREKMYELELLKENKMAAIGQLTAGIAHNLNTPISIIQGNAELLNVKFPDAEEVKMILRQTDRMNQLIHTIITKGKNELNNENTEINLNDLIQTEIDFLHANLYFKHYIDCVLKLDQTIPNLFGKYSDYSQSISVIIQNAIDAMYKVEKRKLQIETKAEESFISVNISDTGSGMDDYTKSKIFDPFFTTKPEPDEIIDDEKVPRGTGLGLSIVHNIWEKCNIDVSVESEIGKGTKFTLKIPYKVNTIDA